MSSLQPLVIKTGYPWSWTSNLTSAGQPFIVTDPVLVMRRDLLPDGALIARFDTSGEADGLVTFLTANSLQFTLPETFTRSMLFGRGFWELSAVHSGVRIPVDSGTVVVRRGVLA